MSESAYFLHDRIAYDSIARTSSPRNSSGEQISGQFQPFVSNSCRTLFRIDGSVLRPSKFEGHCPMIRHGCRMALMVAL
ncbi:MAG: hypothetical protein BECKG1743F_GA0114225_102254, partial [Candidatus Kentron sp. G]